MARTSEFQTIRSEGGLLPSDLLRRILDPRAKLEGTSPESYGLPQGERLNEVITQSWNRLCRHWAEFRNIAENLPAGEAATGPTNDKWTLPLLRELGFGTLPTSAAPEIEGRSYPIARFHGPVPLHLVGCGLNLDRRTAGARGAASSNPHGMVQEFLNRSQGHLWAIVSNGRHLRVLRDNQALSRQSFIEFDLEAMFNGQVYPDFVLMWMVAHVSRFLTREGDKADSCLLERWTKIADEEGTRALGELRGSVAKALQVLGAGFTGNPRNTALHTALSTNQLTPADLHAELLRVVYRLIFLFVAEDRQIEGQPLLHPRDKTDAARIARERYAEHYGTARMRELAGSIRGSRHGDLWRQFGMLARLLSDDPNLHGARSALAMPVLGGFLWNEAATPHLNDAELSNHDFLEVLRHLAFTRQGKALRSVDFRNLGAEELGGVYETLLELTPRVSGGGRKFEFAEFAGNERKTSGSYYTPDSLVQCLLDTALDPVVNEAITGKSAREAEAAILALKVCDPAVGSGHFLVGAAHRLARHLSRARALAEGESEPSPLHYQHALRDVIGHCLYGVDINPMSAELCRVGLWLEAMEPGKPLSFLDHHVRVGNSLFGAMPELIAAGLPDDAFTAIDGDDKRFCSGLRQRNKKERGGQRDMLHLMVKEPTADYDVLAARLRGLDEAPDDTIDAIRNKSAQFGRFVESPEYQHAKRIADAWCAAFVWIKRPGVPGEALTTDVVRRLLVDTNALTNSQRDEVARLSSEYQFFHWHLAFPEVFSAGGFDCILGNPPWDQVQFREQEFFSERAPHISGAATEAIRKQLISALADNDPGLMDAYSGALRTSEGGRHFYLNAGRFPLGARGRVNTYLLFVELASQVSTGSVGLIVPSGVATDESGRLLFARLFAEGRIRHLWDFENRERFFQDVDSRARFSLFTFGKHATAPADLCFGVHQVEEALDSRCHFSLTLEDLTKINPNTLTCPSFSSRGDADLVLAIHRRLPILVAESAVLSAVDSWGISTKPGLLNMATDSGLFAPWSDHESQLPVYEGKMFSFFDHRFADVVISMKALLRQGQSEELTEGEHADAERTARPRYWVRSQDIQNRVAGQWDRKWIAGWKEITSPTNARTLVPAILPLAGIGHKIPVFLPAEQCRDNTPALVASLGSFVCDYVCRNKLNGTSLTPFTFKQLPAPLPSIYNAQADWSPGETLREWLAPRILELTYTAWDMEPFALDCGWSGPPFRWEVARRFLLRCELDAAYFHLYLPAEKSGDWLLADGETAGDLARLAASFSAPRAAVAYIMDTFPIVRRKDEEKFDGDYRTKRVILEIYDAMAEAIRTGRPYITRLSPSPADVRCCHPKKGAE